MPASEAPTAPTARSLILDLLSTLPRGAMPVRALVAAAELFGIAGNSVRVALARLLAAGLVARDERGRYRLGEASRPVHRELASWRSLERRVRSWNGRWVGVSGPRGRGARRALRFVGLRELRPGLWLRPDNLAGGVEAARTRLHELGLDATAPVFELGALDSETEAAARSLWDARALRDGYRRSRVRLAESAAGLASLPTGDAMVESFTLGGAVLRDLVLDPLLPEPIVPARERAALVDAMIEYDRAGRACWAEFLRGFGVLSRRAPIHTPADLPALATAEPAGGVA